jgi:predicted porin
MANRIPLAALALLIAPAAVAQSHAVVYGRLYPQLAYVRTSGATPVGAQVSTLVDPATGERNIAGAELQASNSRFGFRGSEALGGGMTAIWQIEQQVNVDAGGAGLASRETYLGLVHAYGALKLGLLDTVYKTIGDTQGFLGIGSGNFVSDSDVLSKCGLGTSSACSFHLRRANSVRYDSPSFDGLELQLQWSPDERRSANRNAWLVSAGIAFERGPLYLAVGYEQHSDLFGGSRNVRPELSNFDDPAARARDYAVRGSAKYAFGLHEVELDVARLAFRESSGAPGRFAEYDSLHSAISLRSRWSEAIRTQASYVYANAGSCALVDGASCSTAGLDGRQLSVGAAWYLSRRTYVYAIASYLRNDVSARYSNLANRDPAAGADITQAALGLATSF